MRGGQYVNNWRMAELHAKEAPDRVRELEAWGAVFDRTPDGRILQRNFGGHRYPRLAHVGDRTGLEMIRTLQDHGIHQGIDRAHGAHGHRAAARRRPRRRRARLRPRARPLPRVPAPRRSCSRPAASAAPTRSPATAGRTPATATRWPTRRRRADRHGVRPVPSRPGWSGRRACRASWSPRACAAKAASCGTAKAAASCSTTSPTTTSRRPPTDPEEGWRYTQGDKNARRPPELLTRDHVARCINREVKAGRGSPHGGVFLDIAWIKEKLPERARSTSSASCRACTTSSRSWPTSTSPRSRWRSGPTTHYIMGGVRVDADTQMSTMPGLFAAGECAAGINGANRLGGNSLSDLIVFGKRAGEYAAQFARRTAPRRRSTTARSSAAMQASLAPFDRGGARREPVQGPARPAGHDAGPGRHRAHRERDAARRSDGSQALQGARARGVGVDGNREYNPGWHTALDLRNLLTVSEAIARCGDRAQGEPRRPLPRGLPGQGRRVRDVQHRRRKRQPDGDDAAVAACRCRRCRAELKQVIEEQK